MSELAQAVRGLTSTSDIREVLEIALSEYYDAPRGILEFERRASEYRSSFPLEELDLVLENGARLQLVFKDVGELLAPAQAAKPAFLLNPLREIEIYLKILSQDRMGTAICYGAVAGPECYWLFLERVQGIELYQVGELAVWQQAARWLAQMHTRQAAPSDGRIQAVPLLRYDPAFYRLWLERAARSLARNGSARWIEWLVERYDRVVSHLCALPATFLHGEFYASNVLVQQSGQGLRICPIDWEMAAVGPGLMDLAALISGKWSEEDKNRLAVAYYAGLEEAGARRLPLDDFLTALDYSRLQLAVQWLGWSPEWTPPPEHVHDWLGEAELVSERLRL